MKDRSRAGQKKKSDKNDQWRELIANEKGMPLFHFDLKRDGDGQDILFNWKVCEAPSFTII